MRNHNPKTTMDVRLAWFAAMVHAVTAKNVGSRPDVADKDGTAALYYRHRGFGLD